MRYFKLCLLITSFSALPHLAAADDELLVYSQNFDDDPFVHPGVSGGFKGAGRREGVQSWFGLGHGTNIFLGRFLRNSAVGNPAPATILELTGLPDHKTISIDFLLAVIDSWDGVDGTGASDLMNVMLDGALIFRESFALGEGSESYIPRPGVELADAVQLGFTGGDFRDGAYDMSLDPTFAEIPHTSSKATISWLASGLGYEGGDNESFAIENVRVRLGDIVPVVNTCDLDGNTTCNAADIDLLTLQIRNGSADLLFDIDGDGQLTAQDRDVFVHQRLSTFFGDANLDLAFDSADLWSIFTAGEYEDAIVQNSTWAEGDWSGDGEFDSADLVLALQDGAYDNGPRPVQGIVPEPANAGCLVAVGAIFILASRSRLLNQSCRDRPPVLPPDCKRHRTITLSCPQNVRWAGGST